MLFSNEKITSYFKSLTKIMIHYEEFEKTSEFNELMKYGGLGSNSSLKDSIHDITDKNLRRELTKKLICELKTQLSSFTKLTAEQKKKKYKKILASIVKKVWKYFISKNMNKNNIIKTLEKMKCIANETERLKHILGIKNIRELLVVIASLLGIMHALGWINFGRMNHRATILVLHTFA